MSSDGLTSTERQEIDDEIERRHPKHVAWTGGSRPGPAVDLPDDEWNYVKKLMIAQLDLWKRYWGDDAPQDVRDIFWGRARYDAHATYRSHRRAKS